MNKKTIGSFGELVAKKYLENRGYIILEKNWRHGHREMDIIAYKNQIIGLEVKTRSKLGPPFTVLNVGQVARLRLILEKYCELNNFNYQLSRLDLIIVKINDKNSVKVSHHLDI